MMLVLGLLVVFVVSKKSRSVRASLFEEEQEEFEEEEAGL
jgi:hypothetical protein